eukprot:3134405-Prymnesium_polylepis.2
MLAVSVSCSAALSPIPPGLNEVCVKAPTHPTHATLTALIAPPCRSIREARAPALSLAFAAPPQPPSGALSRTA